MTSLVRIYPKEAAPFTYTSTLLAPDTTPIPAAQLSTLTLTLYNVEDGSVINSRNGQSVKNANNGTLHATSGLFTWQAQSTDSPIVDPTVPVGHYEHHVARFQWTTLAGGAANVSTHEVDIFVQRLAPVG
jgi:hypothetical protein